MEKKITDQMDICSSIAEKIGKELDEHVKAKDIDTYMIACGLTIPSQDGGEMHSGISAYGNAEDISIGIAHIVLDTAKKHHIDPMKFMLGIWDIMGAIEQEAGYSAER